MGKVPTSHVREIRTNALHEDPCPTVRHGFMRGPKCHFSTEGYLMPGPRNRRIVGTCFARASRLLKSFAFNRPKRVYNIKEALQHLNTCITRCSAALNVIVVMPAQLQVASDLCDLSLAVRCLPGLNAEPNAIPGNQLILCAGIHFCGLHEILQCCR